MTTTRIGPVHAYDSHILLIDDDARIRALLKKYLNRNGFRATEARDAAHARKLLDSLEFDLLVVDVMMPGEDGFSFTRDYRTKYQTPILLLTARGDAEDRITGLEAGADDYLAKPFEPRELLLRIGAILRRAVDPNPPEAPTSLNLGEVRYDIARSELWKDQEQIRLTTTEVTLMRIFASRPNETFSRQDLLKEIGSEMADAQERAVDVQITRLRRKIEADSGAPRYLQTVRGAGYMLAPD